MTWKWKVLVLVVTLLHSATRTQGDCTSMDDYTYECSNMTREKYQTDMDEIISYNTVDILMIIQINLTTLDQHLFYNWQYESVYNLTIKQCGVTTIDNHSFDDFASLQYLYILNNNLKYFNGDFIKPLHNLNNLDLSNNNIQQFNINCNNIQQFRTLTLNNNSITTLLENTFNNCQYLEKLILAFVENIKPGAFNSLSSIVNIDLKNTFRNINIIKKEQFKGLSSLETLDLSDLNIEIVESEAFTGLEKVHTILLQNNNFSSLEAKTFKDLYNLNTLNLTNSGLKMVNSNIFQGLEKINNLILVNNSIHLFPTDSFNGLKFLKYLNLSSLEINIIEPGTFNGLYNLNELNLNGNKIRQLSSNIFNETYKLQKIDLNLSFVENIEPGAFIGLSAVENLNIKFVFQKIKIIKKEQFIGLSSLKTLDLSDLNIKIIEPEAFTGLERVHTILLQNCYISFLDSNVFQSLEHVLSELNLNNNQIENINMSTFANLLSLKTLHLQNNRISVLKPRSLSALGQLRYLDISHNKLSALSESVLHPLEHIEVLDISANRFTHLDPATIFPHLTTLKQIDLSGNSWSCHNLTLIRKYLRKHRISYESKILNFTMENIGGTQCTEDETVNLIDNFSENTNSGNESNKSIETILNDIDNFTKAKLMKISNSINNMSRILDNHNKLIDILTNVLAYNNNKTVNNLKLQSNNVQDTNHDNANYTLFKISKTNNHIYFLLLFILIVFVCYKITYFSLKTYKKKSRKNLLRKIENSRTEMDLLNTDIDSV